jgi:hypothetical protein
MTTLDAAASFLMRMVVRWYGAPGRGIRMQIRAPARGDQSFGGVA